jgi:hypothetical protein
VWRREKGKIKCFENEAGILSWDVENIGNARFSPQTSAYTILTQSLIYRISFDESGTLISEEKTDEIVVCENTRLNG